MSTTPGPAAGLQDAWDVLDRFVQDLQGVQRTSSQFRLLLKAVRDAVHADVVFLHSVAPQEAVEVVGRPRVPAEWCRELAGWALLGQPPGTTQIVRSDTAPAPVLAGEPPQSVAMVQVSRSKNAWVVAVSLSAERVFQSSHVKVMLLARRMLSYHFQQLYTSEELKETLFGLVSCLTATIDAKDPYTCGHSERVARMAVRLGQQMGYPEATISDVYLAGLLHDIGKIGIKDSVLQKPAKLTPEEMQHVQEHPVIGDRIIASIKKLAHLRPGVRNHHERYDGLGYPDRLTGEQIPLIARILAVADACDAMMSPRPYRRALPREQLETIMAQGAGTQWDPIIIEHFLTCRQDLYSICQRGLGESVYVAVEHAVRAANRPSSECAPLAANGKTATSPKP